MKRLATILVTLMMLSLPMKHWGQTPKFNSAQATIEFNITNIALFDERVVFLYNLFNDSRFNVINSEKEGYFIISANDTYPNLDINEAFHDFMNENASMFAAMEKEEAAELAKGYKALLPEDFVFSLMFDIYEKSRQNNLCANADPFCTDNGMYVFPAGVNAGSGEAGPNYACLNSTPNPAWYYMRIANPGGINIYMFSTPSVDIDFCCWGPFDDPVTPCPNGLTLQKKVSCSYSVNPTETCVIPSSAQTGEYYIMVITNFSNQQCNISFQKTGGTGTTDCGILPPLVNNDGPYCVGETIHLTANGQAGATYSWTGPGNFTSNQQNPTRPNCTMNMAGTYTCTIALSGQTNSSTTDVVIHPQPTANFTFTTVCKGNPTQFTSTSTTNPSGQQITSYQWNFGDGQSSNQQNPSHQYANAGTYTVTLTVGCGNGLCTHTKTQNVTVYEAPVANAGPDDFCDYGSTYQLHGTGGAGTFNFHWEPANMVVNPNSQNTQTVALYADQTFTLTVSNPQGQCTDDDQVTIHISGSAMAVTAGPDIEICQGGSGEIYVAAGGGTGNYTFSWTPTTGLSDPTVANPIASPAQTTTYTCHVSDGATSQNASVTVTVNDVIVEHEYVSICPDDYYMWHGTPYSIPGTYQIDTVTAQGCDETLFLHLDHYPTYDETTIHTAICTGESYNFYGTLYDYNCQVAYTDHTIHGCDSIVRLDLTVWPENPLTTNEVTVCPEQLPYTFYGVDYYEETDVTVWDTDIHGCDSAVRLVLSVSDYYMPEVVHKYICYEETPSYTWNPYGNYTFTYTEDGFYADTLPTTACDGIFRLDLHFKQVPEVQHYTVVDCDSYYWPISGETYTATDEYPHSFPIYDDPSNPSTLYNCTEDHLLHLTINPSHTNATTSFSHECDSIPFDWFGTIHYLKTNGTYPFSGETTLGCDSAMLVTVESMKYTPNPSKIQCTDGSAVVFGDTIAVITNTEFFSFNYDFSVQETGLSVWDECVWSISKPSWHIEPYPAVQGEVLNRCCKVYVADRDENYVVLTATARNSCGEATRTFFLKSSFLDVDEHNNAMPDVSIIPNPNDGQMRLNFENMEGRVSIKVYDMTGNRIDAFETFVGSENYSYDYAMKQYAEGIYLFVISDNVRSLTRKVVIIH